MEYPQPLRKSSTSRTVMESQDSRRPHLTTSRSLRPALFAMSVSVRGYRRFVTLLALILTMQGGVEDSSFDRVTGRWAVGVAEAATVSAFRAVHHTMTPILLAMSPVNVRSRDR